MAGGGKIDHPGGGHILVSKKRNVTEKEKLREKGTEEIIMA
jgi:hypothetical protein